MTTGQGAVCADGAVPDACEVVRREWVSGQLIRLVAMQLAAHGFDVRSEECEDDRRLAIAGLAGMRCWVKVEDWGDIECEYVPQRGWRADPVRVAGLVVGRLADGGSEQHGRAEEVSVSGLPLRSVVGRELVAAGLDVKLAVYSDLADFRVLTDLVVSNPDHPERGEVTISDDGSVIMECDLQGAGASPAGIEEAAESAVSDIRQAVARFNAALSLSAPPGQGDQE